MKVEEPVEMWRERARSLVGSGMAANAISLPSVSAYAQHLSDIRNRPAGCSSCEPEYIGCDMPSESIITADPSKGREGDRGHTSFSVLYRRGWPKRSR